MILKYILIPILLVVVFISCENTDTKTDPITDVLHTELDSLLLYSEIDAVSVGVYVNGKTYTLHKGELTVGLNYQPTDETLYEVASLTKTFTGTLLAQAIVENKVGLDDDIRTVLEGDFPNLEYEGNPITFRHLVTH